MLKMDRVEYLTRAYLKAYEIAFKETRNPQLAVQAATGVLLVLKTDNVEPNPLTMLFSAMMQQNQKKGSEEGREKNDDGQGKTEEV